MIGCLNSTNLKRLRAKYEPNLIPKPDAEVAPARAEQQAAEKLKKMAEELAAKDKAITDKRAKREDIDAELVKLKGELAAAG